MEAKTVQLNKGQPRHDERVKAGKVLNGVVVSTKMKDTIVVSVTRFVKHPKYGKFLKRSKRFKAHDVGNTASLGDIVEIMETRPISKDKHFMLKAITAKAKTVEV